MMRDARLARKGVFSGGRHPLEDGRAARASSSGWIGMMLAVVLGILCGSLRSASAQDEKDPKSKREENPQNERGKDENGRDKERNDDDKDKKEDVQKILQLVAEGKMTVEQALQKLVEKPEEKRDNNKDAEEGMFNFLPKGWNLHAQTTIIPESDTGFHAKYSGPNSLSPAAQRAGTVTADLFLGVPLWRGAEFHADSLLWDGMGLSNTFGLEANPDADAYKLGTPTPRFVLAQLFVRQTVGLGGEQEDVPDGLLTLPGKQDVSRLTITVGRMNVANIFDYNTYNHDPHTQFMNWGGGMMLAYDYPADTVGYTTGIAIELNQKDWAVRYGWYQMPSIPNGLTSEDRFLMWPHNVSGDGPTSDGKVWEQWGMVLELERRWSIEDHPGALRLSAFPQEGRWASYKRATQLLIASPPDPNTPGGAEVTIPTAAFGYHYKYGFGLNWEQEIAKDVGMFGRLGWNDGHTAAAAYTDVNWSVQLGLSVKGAAWSRPDDTYGLCGQLDGASSAERAFLKAGGTGISAGDGQLTYGPEVAIETYYDIALTKFFHFALDYQFFDNPAFNRDRGPVNVFLIRLHWQF